MSDQERPSLEEAAAQGRLALSARERAAEAARERQGEAARLERERKRQDFLGTMSATDRVLLNRTFKHESFMLFFVVQMWLLVVAFGVIGGYYLVPGRRTGLMVTTALTAVAATFLTYLYIAGKRRFKHAIAWIRGLSRGFDSEGYLALLIQESEADSLRLTLELTQPADPQLQQLILDAVQGVLLRIWPESVTEVGWRDDRTLILKSPLYKTTQKQRVGYVYDNYPLHTWFREVLDNCLPILESRVTVRRIAVSRSGGGDIDPFLMS